jgi:hypothetical protein
MTNYQFYIARKTCVGSLGGERRNLLFFYSPVLLQIDLWVWLESMDRINYSIIGRNSQGISCYLKYDHRSNVLWRMTKIESDMISEMNKKTTC